GPAAAPWRGESPRADGDPSRGLLPGRAARGRAPAHRAGDGPDVPPADARRARARGPRARGARAARRAHARAAGQDAGGARVRVLLAGKNDTAVEALEFLRERGDEVLVVGIASDAGKDGWQRSLVAAARGFEVPLVQPAKINAPETIAELRAFEPELLV